MIPKAATDPSQAFADTPIGQSLLKLDESQRKRLEICLILGMSFEMFSFVSPYHA
jgi:hypothetical protein